MFTGIIEEIGKVTSILSGSETKTLILRTKKVFDGVKPGDSIAVNGVCLTVTNIKKNILSFDVMNKTIEVTGLKNIRKDCFVNIERALRANASFDGHFVYGHIDGIRKITGLKKGSLENFIDVELRPEDRKYVVRKGSVAIDGISLTIGECDDKKIRLFLIPHTWNNTILQFRKKGDTVNIEFDMLAKYVYKQTVNKGLVTKDLLKETGFM